MEWSIERKVQWGLGIAGAVLCGMAVIAYALIVTFVNTSNGLLHTHVVIERTQAVRTSVDDAEAAVRGYSLTHDPSFLAPYELVHGRIPGIVDRLLALTSDNADERRRMGQLKSQINQAMGLLQQQVNAERTHAAPPEVQLKLVNEEQQVTSQIRNTLRATRTAENELLTSRDRAWRESLTLAIVAAAILGLLNFVLLGYIYYVFKRDLTERRRAEAALWAGEERLRLMIASVRDYAFFMLDPQGRVASWNDGAAIIKGYEAGEIIGQHFSTFFLEEDQKAGKPQAALEQATQHGRMELEGWRRRKDGSRFWTDAITTAIRDEHGHLLGFSEVARDLTERKRTEEKLQESQSRLAAVLDGSPSVIFVKDPEGRYTLVNQRFETSFRLKREDVLGKSDLDLFPRATAQTLREHDAQALEAGRALEFEETIPQKDGVHIYLSARVPLLGEDRQPYALCGVSTDITERKEREQQIQKLNRALQDRVIDRSVQLMQATDELKMERAQRKGAEEREREVRDRLREVMQNSPVPMWTYNLETLELLEANNAAAALHGASRQDLAHMRMTDLYPQEEIRRLQDEVMTGGATPDNPILWHYRSRTGQLTPVGVLARRVEWDGHDAALVVVVSESEAPRFRDITKVMEAADS